MVDESVHTFLIDENVTADALSIAKGLDQRVNFITANDAGLAQTPDAEIFTYSVEHDLIIVTGNIKDFRPLVVKHLQSGGEFAGIIFVKPEHQKNAAHIARRLVELAFHSIDNLEVFI